MLSVLSLPLLLLPPVCPVSTTSAPWLPKVRRSRSRTPSWNSTVMRYVQLFDSSTIKEGKEGKERRRKEKGKGWKKEKTTSMEIQPRPYMLPLRMRIFVMALRHRGETRRGCCVPCEAPPIVPRISSLPANKRLPGSTLSHVHMSLTSSFRSFLDDPDYLEGNQRKGMSTVVPPLLVPRSVPVKTNTLRHDS